MKKLIIAAILAMSCATTNRVQNPYEYNESETCPIMMSQEQRESGVVRCRALCSSYARDFAQFTDDCKCWCAPAAGKSYAPPQERMKHQTNET